MGLFIGVWARPTRFVLVGLLGVMLGCGEDPVVEPALPAPTPMSAPASEVDEPLKRAKRDAENAQRSGDGLREAQAFRVYATVLRARGKDAESSQVLLGAIGAAVTVWGGDDAARRDDAELEIDGGCADLEELINHGIVKQRLTHREAVTWYGQLHALMHQAGRRAHAAALRHLQSHHASNAAQYADAERWAAEAVRERRALGLKVPAAWSVNQLGYVQLARGKHDAAWDTLGEAVHSMCGVGLNAVARATIQNLCAVIRSHIEAGRTERATALLRELWGVAGGNPKADPPWPGWTGAEQAFVLEQSKVLHLLAGNLDDAEQALLAILWISHRGEVFRPDVDAALWLEMAIFAHEQRKDYVRALRYCAASMELHQLIEHSLGRAWVHVRRGAILLDQAQMPGVADGPARRLIEEAIAECRAGLKLFEECGNHRNGRLMAIQHLKLADDLRQNPDGAQAWAEQMAPLWAEPPPEPGAAYHFPPVDEMWKGLARGLATTAPLARVVRDETHWVVTDLVDNTERRVPFSWQEREVVVRLLQFRLGGGTLRTSVEIGGYAVYVPPFHGAQILRNGLIVPAGRMLPGGKDYATARGAHQPPALLAGAAAGPKTDDKK